jgi:hypothetical protein
LERPEEREHRGREPGDTEADGRQESTVEELSPGDTDDFLVDRLVLDDRAGPAPGGSATEDLAGVVGALTARGLEFGRCRQRCFTRGRCGFIAPLRLA